MILLTAILLAQAPAVLNPCPTGSGVQASKAASTVPAVTSQDFPILQPDLIPIVVKIELVVSEFGKPCNLRVIDPKNSDLEASAIESVSKWRFKPGMRKGKPVAVPAIVEVKFLRPEGGFPPDFDSALRHFSSGEPKMVDRAIEILEALSANRHAQADAFLGYILYKGMRVRQDHEKSVRLITRSFSEGVPFAVFAMGLILAEGKALPADRPKALMLIGQAAASGVPAAKQWLAQNNLQ